MKVLLIVSEFPPVRSGVARCAQEIAEGLRSRDHQVDVISGAEMPRLTLGEFRFTGFAGRWRQIAGRLSAYDVVNLHGPVPTMSDAFLALLRTVPVAQRPAVVYTHHSDIDLKGWGLACAAYNGLHRALARAADRIVVTSHAYARALRATGGPPVHVVPWGVDVERFDAGTTAARSAPGRLKTLFVGQMRPYKGLGHLMEAVAAEPGVSLTVVGGGPLEDRYRAEAERLGPQIDFRGRVSDETLASLYRDHDAIALPSVSRGEAFGLVLLEGMAAGCVPVASDLPGVAEVAGDTGVLVRPGDVNDLRAALRRLADDVGMRAARADASRRKVLDMGWDRAVSRYDGILRGTVLDRQRRSALPLLPPAWVPPEHLLTHLEGRFEADWSSLLVFERDRRDLRVRAAWGRVDAEHVTPPGPRLARYVAATGRPLVLPADEAPAMAGRWLEGAEVESAVAVPFPLRRGAIVLSLGSTEPGRRFSEHDISALLDAAPPLDLRMTA